MYTVYACSEHRQHSGGCAHREFGVRARGGGGPFLRGGALSRGHGTSPVTAGRRLRLLSANTASASSSDQTNGHRNLALGVYFHSICRLQ